MAEASAARTVANGTKRLADAVRAAKVASAQRTDAVVDIREADRARLEMLAEELQPVVDAVPADDDLFDFFLSPGPCPRFFVDGTAHVSMGRDRRTYRLMRETRLGRVTLAESSEAHVMADRVTDYVAQRIVERDRAYAMDDGLSERLLSLGRAAEGPEAPIRASAAQRSSGVVTAISWLLIGIVVGAATLIGLAVLRGVPIV